MKHLKIITVVFTVALLIMSCKNQNKEPETQIIEEAVKVDLSIEKEAVKAVMKSYKDAIQNLIQLILCHNPNYSIRVIQ
jgi:hypothetical protein